MRPPENSGERRRPHFQRSPAIFWRTHFSGKAAPRLTAIFWRTHFSGNAAPPNNRSEEPPNNRSEEPRHPHQTPKNPVAPTKPRISEELHFRQSCVSRVGPLTSIFLIYSKEPKSWGEKSPQNYW